MDSRKDTHSTIILFNKCHDQGEPRAHGIKRFNPSCETKQGLAEVASEPEF